MVDRLINEGETMTINFEYNESDQRTKKTGIETGAAGIEHTTTTDYILHGTNIMHLYQGRYCTICRTIFFPETTKGVSDIRNSLSHCKENIYYGALRLAQLASQYETDLSAATPLKLGLILSSYNSGKKQTIIGPYGAATLSYYYAFQEHMTEWGT